MPLRDEELEGLGPRELLQLGIDLFNAGRHFDSHEAWEAAWIPSERPLRFFYQGLIQVAAAFVHLTRKEYPGTEKLLREALAKLERFRPDCLGVEVERLINETTAVQTRVLEAGPRRLSDISAKELPKIVQQRAPELHLRRFEGVDLSWLEWYSIAGDGPAVVLVHSPGLVARVWQPVASRLTEGYRVLAPDLPGHGRSSSGSGFSADAVALESWMQEVAPDAVAVVAGDGAIGVSSRLGVMLGKPLIHLGAGDSAMADGSTDPRRDRDVWPGRWGLYRALQNLPPFDRWRADLLWTYVEDATELLEGAEDTQDAELPRGMTGEPSVRLRTDPNVQARVEHVADRGVDKAISASPLSQPGQAAKMLKEVIDTLL